jgi:outer membrane protein assembly factor BamB
MRRAKTITVVAAVLLAALFSAHLSLAETGKAAGDWPRFQGTDGSAVSSATGLLRAWPADGPTENWSVEIGEGFGGPAIAGGKVYLLDRDGKTHDKLRVFDLASGRELWHYRYEAAGKVGYAGSRSTPTVDGQHVYTLGPFGHLHCINTRTQQVVWSKNMRSDFNAPMPRWGYAQSPLIHGGHVILSVRSSEVGVVALNKMTGQVVWKSKSLGRSEAYASPMLATLAGVEQVVVLHNRMVAGLSPADGAILWTYDGFDGKRPIPSPTIVDGDRIFLTMGYGGGCAMVRIEESGGKLRAVELFKDRRSESKTGGAVFYDGHIYSNSNDNRSGLHCMTPEGEIKWQTERNPSFDMGQLIIAGGMIYILDGKSGTLRLAEATPKGYSELASSKLLDGGKIWGAMALADGKLVLRDQKQMKCVTVGR